MIVRRRMVGADDPLIDVVDVLLETAELHFKMAMDRSRTARVTHATDGGAVVDMGAFGRA